MGYQEARATRYTNIDTLIRSITETLKSEGFEVYFSNLNKKTNYFLFVNRSTKQINFFSFSEVPYRWCVGAHKTLLPDANKADLLREVYETTKSTDERFNAKLKHYDWLIRNEANKQ